MVSALFSRRALIASISAFSAGPHMAWAADYIDLEWTDLVPTGQPAIPPMIQDLPAHDQAALSGQQPKSNVVRDDWNGKTVRLPGFIVPIDYSGTGVTAFILVPFVGACVHVPPPPRKPACFCHDQRPLQKYGSV